MNTTELIEIAIECGACITYIQGSGKQTAEFFMDELQQFAQRIEQPLLDRIVELSNTANANLNAKDKQIKQLREALQGFLDAFNGGYEPSLQTVFIASKAMEQTK